MKRRSAPLDEIFNELMFVLEQDGGRLAKSFIWVFHCRYRCFQRIVRLALLHPWRTDGDRR